MLMAFFIPFSIFFFVFSFYRLAILVNIKMIVITTIINERRNNCQVESFFSFSSSRFYSADLYLKYLRTSFDLFFILFIFSRSGTRFSERSVVPSLWPFFFLSGLCCATRPFLGSFLPSQPNGHLFKCVAPACFND